LLEEKDFEMIENKLKSALNYEWLYYEFKKAVKENMDELVRDIAESFAFSILYENKYEYDESSGQIKDCGNTTLTTMRNWGIFCVIMGL